MVSKLAANLLVLADKYRCFRLRLLGLTTTSTDVAASWTLGCLNQHGLSPSSGTGSKLPSNKPVAMASASSLGRELSTPKSDSKLTCTVDTKYSSESPEVVSIIVSSSAGVNRSFPIPIDLPDTPLSPKFHSTKLQVRRGKLHHHDATRPIVLPTPSALTVEAQEDFCGEQIGS